MSKKKKDGEKSARINARAVIIASIITGILGLTTAVITTILKKTNNKEATTTLDNDFYTLQVSTGKLPQGARITVMDTDGNIISEVMTYGDGEASIKIPVSYKNKEVKILFTIPGYYVSSQKIKLGIERIIKIEFNL